MSAFFAAGWALAGAGGWAQTFGLASAIFAALDSADSDTDNEGKAHGLLYTRWAKTHLDPSSDSTEAYNSMAPLYRDCDGDSGEVDFHRVIDTQTYEVGYRYTFFIEMNSACSLKSSDSLFGGCEVESEIVLRCTGMSGWTATEDFGNHRLYLKCPVYPH